MLKMSVGLSQRRKNGGRTRARTWDPLIKSQLLYQLSYAPIFPATTGRRKPRENIRIRRKCKGFGPGKLLFCASGLGRRRAGPGGPRAQTYGGVSDRKRAMSGKRVAVRVNLGGRGSSKKKKT